MKDGGNVYVSSSRGAKSIPVDTSITAVHVRVRFDRTDTFTSDPHVSVRSNRVDALTRASKPMG